MRILMLGNSFTSANGMPQMLAALTGGEVVCHTRGGARLSEQLDPDTRLGFRTQAALAGERWDYMVLQEMSRGPITAPKSFFSSVERLCRQIRANGAVPVLFATWAYLRGGAKMEETAYLPLLDQLRRTVLTCVLVEAPFRMAIFDADAAEDVMAQFPDIEHWYIAGHSLGGAMASRFAADHPEAIDGLILLGAYLYGDYPPADTFTVYGSLNQSVEDEIDYTENVVEIQGGNCAQFGNCGPRRGTRSPPSRRRSSRLRRRRPWRTLLTGGRDK